MLKTNFRWRKFIAIWACVLLLHFSYEWFPSLLLRLLAPANETVFLHMKMLFVAYVLVSLVEFLIQRHAVRSTSSFLTGRALVAVAYPWLAITFWFFAWAVGLTFDRLGEVLYANLATVLGIYLALRMEEILATVELRPALKWVILLLFLAALVSYVSFSLNPPLHFFTTPPGQGLDQAEEQITLSIRTVRNSPSDGGVFVSHPVPCSLDGTSAGLPSHLEQSFAGKKKGTETWQ